MSSPLPQWHSFTKSSHGYISRRHNGFFHSFNSIPGMVFFGLFFLIGLILCTAFLSHHSPLLIGSSESYGLFQLGSNNSTPTNYASSSHASDEAPPSLSDTLSLEQVRAIVATTRGFFARDYSLNLGWNNVGIRGNLSVIQAELMVSK